MKWTCIFAKSITLTDYFKTYLHETTYSQTVSTKKGYVVDSESSFFKRNGTNNNVISKSFSYSSGIATRYSYGSKYQLVAPEITLNNNIYTYCTIKVTNPNPVSVTYYDRDVSSSGSITIGANSYITYEYTWTKGQYEQETHTFSGYIEAYQCSSSSTSSLSVDKPYDTKPTLTSPSITISDNTNYSFNVTYTNNASVTAKLYTYNGNISLESGDSKTYTIIWSTSSLSVYAWASASGYNDSDTTRKTVTRPAQTKLIAPKITLNNNTYTQCTIKITNPNSVACTYYDNDLGHEDIPANGSIIYDYAWTKGQYEQETHTFSGYLTATGYTSSLASSLSVDKPYDVKPLDVSISAKATASSGGNVKFTLVISCDTSGSWTLDLSSSKSSIDFYKTGSGTGTFTYTVGASAVIGDTISVTLKYTSGTQTTTKTTTCTIVKG